MKVALLVRAGIVVKTPPLAEGFFRLRRNPGDLHEVGSGIPIPKPTQRE